MTNKIMILAGMHRSGTSVTSQWLQQCNLHIGDELLGPAAGNIEGHFEDANFVRAHEKPIIRFKGKQQIYIYSFKGDMGV